jgi:chromosomal replication initiator protein
MARLEPSDFTGKGRRQYIVRPRQAIMLAARRRGKTLNQIGAALGGKDHTTILYGARRAERREAEHKLFAALVRDLECVP